MQMFAFYFIQLGLQEPGPHLFPVALGVPNIPQGHTPVWGGGCPLPSKRLPRWLSGKGYTCQWRRYRKCEFDP